MKKKIESFPTLQQTEEDRKIDWMIKQEIQEEADEVEASLLSDQELADLKVPEGLYDKIVTQLKQEGNWESDGTEGLSEEDREALRLGREMQTRQKEQMEESMLVQSQTHGKGKKKSWWKAVGKVAAMASMVVLCVFGVSMTSEANRQYVIEWLTKSNGTKSFAVEVSNDENRVYNQELEEAYNAVEERLGIKPLLLLYLPENMVMQSFSINETGGEADLTFNNNGKQFYVYMQNNKFSFSYQNQVDGQIIEKRNIHSQVGEVEMLVYEDQGEKIYYVSLNTEGESYYAVWGKIEEKEFVNIIENMKF